MRKRKDLRIVKKPKILRKRNGPAEKEYKPLLRKRRHRSDKKIITEICVPS